MIQPAAIHVSVEESVDSGLGRRAHYNTYRLMIEPQPPRLLLLLVVGAVVVRGGGGSGAHAPETIESRIVVTRPELSFTGARAPAGFVNAREGFANERGGLI